MGRVCGETTFFPDIWALWDRLFHDLDFGNLAKLWGYVKIVSIKKHNQP